jgi:hypothetical protein
MDNPVTKGYRIDIGTMSYAQYPDFKDSDVYRVTDNDGKVIGQLCKEYRSSAGKPVAVFYCTDDDGNVIPFRDGLIVREGNPYVYIRYITGWGRTNHPFNDAPDEWEEGSVITPVYFTDTQGIQCPIVRIGDFYWMKENLKLKLPNHNGVLDLNAAYSCNYERNSFTYEYRGCLYNGLGSLQVSNQMDNGITWRLPTLHDIYSFAYATAEMQDVTLNHRLSGLDLNNYGVGNLDPLGFTGMYETYAYWMESIYDFSPHSQFISVEDEEVRSLVSPLSTNENKNFLRYIRLVATGVK